MKLAHIERVRLVEGLDRDASRTYRLWESAGHVLKEFQLDQKQIDQLFAQVEKDATAAGGNRTALGKGIDTTTAAGKAVKTAYDDLVDKVQNSGPMQNADAMYDQAAEKLKQATGGDQGVMKYVQKYRDFAKKHPIAQSFIYAALIAAAGISGAGLGGAAALGLLKMTDQLLQGKKFSTALGKGAMTGATAYAASNILGGGGDLPSDPNAPGYQVGAEGPASAPGQFDAPTTASQDFGLTPGGVDPNATQNAIDSAAKTAADAGKEGAKSAAGTAATNRAGQVAADTATTVAQGAGVDMFPGLATDQMANDSIKRIADKIASGSLTKAEMDHLQATQSWIRAQITDAGYQTAPKEFWSYHDLLDKMTRAADNITVKESRARYIDPESTVRNWALNESLGRKRGGVQLTEAGVNRVFALVEAQALNEGIMDTLKGAAGKVTGAIKGAAGKAGAAIAQTGKNLTTKFTADKLKQAWEAEGGNTDNEAIKIFLKQQGVDPAVIDSSMKAVGAPAVGAPAAAGASQFVQDLVAGYMTLTPAERAEIMKELDVAIDVSGNSNLVKGMNESKRRKKAVR